MGLSIDLDAEYEPERAFHVGASNLLDLQTLVTAYLEAGQRGSRFPLLMRRAPNTEVRYEPLELPDLLAELGLVCFELEALWVPAVESNVGDEVDTEPISLSMKGTPQPLFFLDTWQLGVDRQFQLFVDIFESRERVLSSELLPDPPWYRTREGQTIKVAPPIHLQLGTFWPVYRATSSLALDHLAPLLTGFASLAELGRSRQVGLRIA